jgi:hypothetical protein
MSEQDATQQNATQPLAQEHCLCREIANRYSGPLRTWSCKRFRSLKLIYHLPLKKGSKTGAKELALLEV